MENIKKEILSQKEKKDKYPKRGLQRSVFLENLWNLYNDTTLQFCL